MDYQDHCLDKFSKIYHNLGITYKVNLPYLRMYIPKIKGYSHGLQFLRGYYLVNMSFQDTWHSTEKEVWCIWLIPIRLKARISRIFRFWHQTCGISAHKLRTHLFLFSLIFFLLGRWLSILWSHRQRPGKRLYNIHILWLPYGSSIITLTKKTFILFNLEVGNQKVH